MSNAADRLCALVVETAESKPIKKQVEIYRDCAEILARESDAIRLRRVADDLEAASARCHQLVLEFQTRN